MFQKTLVAMAALWLGSAQLALAEDAYYDDWRFYRGSVDGLPGSYCVAETRAGRVSLFLAATPNPDGTVALHTVLSDPRWNHAGEPITYRLAFDEFNWRIRGWGDNNVFRAHFSDKAKYLEFMEDIASREMASLYAASGDLLANFSLEGSRSATIDLEYCVETYGGTLGNVEDVKRN